MKKNGYTLVELLVLIGIMGIVAFITISKTAYAFKDNTEELYENERSLIVRQSKEYGKSLENLKEEKEVIIMVSELIEKDYLAANSDGNYVDVRNGKSLNDLKVKISYNEENGEVDAVIID